MFGQNHEKPVDNSNQTGTIGNVPHGGEPVLDEFGSTELHEVEDHLIETLPDHPGVIDPLTNKVDFVPFQKPGEVPAVATPEAPAKAPWYTKTASKVAGAALALTAVVGGGAAVMGGDDKTVEPRDTTKPTASAPVTPGGEQTQPTTPEKSPSLGEIVASVEKYPTAAEAITPLFEQIDKYRNYFTGEALTDKQIQEHDQLLESVFGPSYLTANVAPFREGMEREWREIMDYKSLTKLSIDSGYGKEMFEAHLTPTNIIAAGPNEVRFTVDSHTNAHATGIDERMTPEYAVDVEGEFQARAILAQQEGGWYIKEYYVQK